MPSGVAARPKGGEDNNGKSDSGAQGADQCDWAM